MPSLVWVPDNDGMLAAIRDNFDELSGAADTSSTDISGIQSDISDLQGIEINAGTGLTGGGDLTANRTISLDAASIASLALADTAIQPGGVIPTTGYTFATLPGTPTQGDRAYITDSSVTTFGSTAAGGGASVMPVFYDGTNWIIA